MLEYKAILGVVAITIGFISYALYVRGVIAGKTKPHAFSWLVWAILVSIIFVVQYTEGGAAGAWVTGFTGIFQLVIFLFAIQKGERKFSRSDWIFLIIALISLALWRTTDDPTLSVVLITLTDFFAFVPTLKKGFAKPEEDSVALWGLTGLKWGISLIALSSFSFAALLYPLYLFIFTTLYAGLLIVRRKLLAHKK